jgi:HK97 family phage major capsid protein
MPDEIVETQLYKDLREQRLKAVEQARSYAEREARGETLSDTGSEEYRKANADIDRYGTLMQDELKHVTEDLEIRNAFEKAEELRRKPSGAPGNRPPGEKSLGDKMREDLAASRRGEARNGGMYQAIPSEAERRDLVSGNGFPGGPSAATKGAETIPVTLVSNLYQKLFDDSAILGAGPTILRTESGETMKLPRLTGLGTLTNTTPGAGSSRVFEAGAIQENDPTFDQVQLDAYKYAQYTQVSRELVEDGVLDIEALIGQVLGRNISNYLGLDLTLGTGTNQPNGIATLVPAGNKVTGATGRTGLPYDPGTGLGNFDTILDVIAKLKPGYRRNAKFLVNDTSMFSLRKLKMNGLYAWEPGLQGAGQPDQLMGYPILSDPNIPAFAAIAGTAVTMIFGDFSAYFVRLVRDVRIEWSMEFAWVNDLLSVKAVVRADGDAIDNTAFAAFVSPAT